ncbi:ABC-type multidrug transport system fused ATPase/permease subunit [Mycoplasma testudineum]|uniref:ABC-type multidrug transport system fused ATPase/permease subunit n=1 Tax=Mycoplasma testudineum TaxID=244584 RepID=A0A4R6IE22_9MOLU|nr:ABC transporter ATP-binding protein [Mycoplasma testudineum]OYD26974.1 hypothetical protein CG473_01400 [Mycoplasma testudineum]TDO20520.1 ABC-type multidrug transport system fused ATPase/permease subunit [Mycoplasma testudineum]
MTTLLNFNRPVNYYLKKSTLVAILLIISDIVGTGFLIAGGFYITTLMNMLIINNANQFYLGIPVLAAITVAAIIGLTSKNYLVAVFELKIQKIMRHDLVDFTNHLSYNDQQKIGLEILHNWFNLDIEKLSTNIVKIFNAWTNTLVSLIVTFILFATYPDSNILLAILFVVGVLINLFLPLLLKNLISNRELNVSKTQDKFSQIVSDFIDSLRYLTLNFYVKYASEKICNAISNRNKSYKDLSDSRSYKSTINQLSQFLYELAFYILIIILFLYRDNLSPVIALSSIAIMVTISETFKQAIASTELLSDSLVNYKSNKKIIDKWNTEFENMILDNNFESSQIINSIKFINFSSKFINSSLANPISFELNKDNSKCLILGKNGSGKSTLINTILKINTEYEGTILLNDKDIKKWSQKEILDSLAYTNNINKVFELTIDENISLTENDKVSSEIKKSALINFDEPASNILNLSTGQKQRIDLARNFFRNKNFGIYDEALSNIDEKQRKEIESRILENNDKLVMFISHSIDEQQQNKFNKIIKL